MTISVREIIEALDEQESENAGLRQQITDLEDAAFKRSQLIWSLAQAQGVKVDQPYLEADVLNTAIALQSEPTHD